MDLPSQRNSVLIKDQHSLAQPSQDLVRSYSADPALLDPLLSLAGDRTDEQQGAAIAALGVGDRDLDGEALAPKGACLSDVQGQRACVVLGSSPNHHTDQKYSFNPNWMMRPSRADRIRPNVLESARISGGLKTG